MRTSLFRSPWRAGAKRALSFAVITALGLSAPTALPAADQPVTADHAVGDHERRIKELEDTIKQLKKDERQLKVNVENQKPLAGWADGFNLASPDGSYKLRIGGYTQLDGRFFIDDRTNTETNQFIFRRARIDLSGTVAKYFDFRILPDFAPATPILFDAYVDANFTPLAKLRVGKFKGPVGLDRLQSATALPFIERDQPTNLVPNRDYGVQLFGDLVGGAFSYQLAIVNGAPDGSNPSNPGDTNDDKDFDGRIFAVPFKNTSIDLLKGLGLGVAGSFGHERGNSSNADLPTFKTFGQNTFFQYAGAVAVNSSATPPIAAQSATLASGDHTRYAPQIYYYWQQFGLLGEYVNSTQRVKRDAATATLSNDAWSIGASYVLTGENASYKGVAPAQPFNPFTGTWGAFEVGGRYGQLEVDPDSFKNNFATPNTSARRDKEWVVGVNWYVNRNVKFVLNYAQSDFRGGAAKGGDRESEKAVVGRVQLLL
jgi:phosphate-selective porin OprO and OprP